MTSQIPDEELANFFGGYFHQDWDLDDPDWESVCRRYVTQEGHQAALSISDAILKLLNSTQDVGQLKATLNGFGSYFFPSSTSNCHEWLKRVAQSLKASSA